MALFQGRIEAENILYKNSHLGDGTFLVRESETHPGDYSLSFLYQNIVHHSRIKLSYSSDGHKTYELNEHVTFSTLYELIDCYKTKPLKSDKFDELYIKESAPNVIVHEDMPWFYEDLSREEAEDILRRLRHNGAFLVRPSEKEENQFSISFRYCNFQCK